MCASRVKAGNRATIGNRVSTLRPLRDRPLALPIPVRDQDLPTYKCRNSSQLRPHRCTGDLTVILKAALAADIPGAAAVA